MYRWWENKLVKSLIKSIKRKMLVNLYSEWQVKPQVLFLNPLAIAGPLGGSILKMCLLDFELG